MSVHPHSDWALTLHFEDELQSLRPRNDSSFLYARYVRVLRDREHSRNGVSEKRRIPRRIHHRIRTAHPPFYENLVITLFFFFPFSLEGFWALLTLFFSFLFLSCAFLIFFTFNLHVGEENLP